MLVSKTVDYQLTSRVYQIYWRVANHLPHNYVIFLREKLLLSSSRLQNLFADSLHSAWAPSTRYTLVGLRWIMTQLLASFGSLHTIVQLRRLISHELLVPPSDPRIISIVLQSWNSTKCFGKSRYFKTKI